MRIRSWKIGFLKRVEEGEKEREKRSDTFKLGNSKRQGKVVGLPINTEIALKSYSYNVEQENTYISHSLLSVPDF